MRRIIILTFAILLVLTLTACGERDDSLTWQNQYSLGSRYMYEGDYENAIIIFTAATETDPTREDAYLGLANAYAKTGDMEQAVQVLIEALDNVNDTSEIQRQLDSWTLVNWGSCGDNVEWRLYTCGTLKITGSGPMYDYDNPTEVPWYKKLIEDVEIEEGITSIGAGAFYGDSLISVTIPSTVNSIGNSAFRACINLTSITIPSSVTDIGIYAFEDCYSLTEIIVDKGNHYYCSIDGVLFTADKTTLITYPILKSGADYTVPISVTSIGSSAFRGCNNLTSVIMQPSVTHIGMYAFNECKSLTSVVIPSSVISIGEAAFGWCSNLTDITIPFGVNSIGVQAFSYCSSLTSITIPASVAGIGEQAFVDCEKLASITVDSGNPYYSSVDGVLFSADKTQLIAYPAGKSDTVYVIPDFVNDIERCAFSWCGNLTSVIIPSNVTNFGDSVFFGCNLTSIAIPSSLTRIETNAFFACNVDNVYFEGSEAEWTRLIDDYNSRSFEFGSATVHFNS